MKVRCLSVVSYESEADCASLINMGFATREMCGSHCLETDRKSVYLESLLWNTRQFLTWGRIMHDFDVAVVVAAIAVAVTVALLLLHGRRKRSARIADILRARNRHTAKESAWRERLDQEKTLQRNTTNR